MRAKSVAEEAWSGREWRGAVEVEYSWRWVRGRAMAVPGVLEQQVLVAKKHRFPGKFGGTETEGT